MKNILIIIIFLYSSTVCAVSEVLLFSKDNEYFGCFGCSEFDSNSICNKYGKYGNKYSNNSIWNEYGVGSVYHSDSPFSKYGSGLKVVDRSGNFHGYFSRSSVAPKQTRDYLNGIWDLSDGNYTNLRDYFCENPVLLGN